MMEYTDENFYGDNQMNNQSRLTPDSNQGGDVELLGDMGTTIAFTFFKTAFYIIVGFFYFVAVLFSLSPKLSLKVFETIGAKKATLVCYERIYNDSDNIGDLYNLIQQSIKNKNHKKTAMFIKIMQENEGYDLFCVNVNKATLEVTEKKYVAYLGDLDSYLVSQRIVALYKSGSKKASEIFAINDLLNENVYSVGIASYIDCLLADAGYSKSEKNNKIQTLLDVNINSDYNINQYIDYRLEMANYLNAEENNINDKILRVYTCLKIQNLKLKIAQTFEYENKEQQAKNNIAELQQIYEELIA